MDLTLRVCTSNSALVVIVVYFLFIYDLFYNLSKVVFQQIAKSGYKYFKLSSNVRCNYTSCGLGGAYVTVHRGSQS